MTIKDFIRPIPGFPSYGASSDGRVWCCGGRGSNRGKIVPWREVRQHMNHTGYFRVFLSLDGRGRPLTVHRAVVMAFKGGIPEGLQVNHINGVKTDNRLENLEICTGAENMRHAEATGLRDIRGAKNGRAKLTEEQVRMILGRHKHGETQTAIAAEFGVSQVHIGRIVNGVAWRGAIQ